MHLCVWLKGEAHGRDLATREATGPLERWLLEVQVEQDVVSWTTACASSARQQRSYLATVRVTRGETQAVKY